MFLSVYIQGLCSNGIAYETCRHQLLVDDDLGPLYDLLVDEPAEIRRAIGELVYDHLIAQKYNSSQSGSKGSFASSCMLSSYIMAYVHIAVIFLGLLFSGSVSDSTLITLGRMLQILREFSTDPILIAYVIDDVWEYMKAMKVCC